MRLSLTKIQEFLDKINNRFPSGTVKTHLKNQNSGKVEDILVKQDNKFIAIVIIVERKIELICFDIWIMENPFLKKEIFKFSSENEVLIELSNRHIVSLHSLRKECRDKNHVLLETVKS